MALAVAAPGDGGEEGPLGALLPVGVEVADAVEVMLLALPDLRLKLAQAIRVLLG